MKIATIVGARPQFIKAAPVTRALEAHGHTEYMIHTGQHYDYNMSQIFFDELHIPLPHFNLGIGSGLPGYQTGQMLVELEKQILALAPDLVLVYGDTNSTLAGALAACKLHIPLAHVEAGLRSFNRQMPEEHNRVLTDHCADFLFCPTLTAVQCLAKEGLRKGVSLVGDTMYDAALHFLEMARAASTILQRLDLQPQTYLLATLHRPYNVDAKENLQTLLTTLLSLQKTVVFPVHPRTRKHLIEIAASIPISQIKLIDPVGYLDMLILEQNAQMILTDSGGVQKEAYFFQVPCITLRPETEWLETVETGWNVIVGDDHALIVDAVYNRTWPTISMPLFGDGKAAQKIVEILAQ